MGYVYYSLMVMIPETSKIEFVDILKHLENKFSSHSQAHVEQVTANKITIDINSWEFTINWEDYLYVSDESREITEIFAKNRDDQAIIASSSKRITTHGDPDPNMDHFNDYISLLEVFESLENVYIYDDVQGKIWKSGEIHG